MKISFEYLRVREVHVQENMFIVHARYYYYCYFYLFSYGVDSCVLII